jgi:uracil-DNA glycosylase
MLVGESPGYDGCRWTGIPFTSGDMVRNSKHKMFKEIGNRIVLKQVVKEKTGTIVWKYLENDKPVPVLWNSFPFHPHKEGNPESNRQPSSSEVQEGVEYMKMVFDIFKPKTVCSLGRVGEKTLVRTFSGIDIKYIRHPSHGGKNGFIEGMNIIINRI